VGDHSSQFGAYIVPLLLIVFILRRAMTARQLKVERLWIYPVILVVLAASALAPNPPTTPAAIGALVVGLVLGGVAGWYRGRLTHITVDPETHDLTSKASPIGVILIVGLMAIRFGVRYYLESHTVSGPLGAYASLGTDVLLVFSVGMMSVARLEMWQRASKLLAESIAAKAARGA
jgi:hypothetical protein